MDKKSLKFRDYLAASILSGEKDVTWRLFDDKNLSVGDEIDLINWNTGEKFGEAVITNVQEKKMGELEGKDFEGHEKFTSKKEMFKTYSIYYENKVDENTIVKIIHFKAK